MEKFRAELRRFIADLYEGEKKVLVFGEGCTGARVMLVGEAPGEQETLQGRPFVGKAGRNLDEFLALAGIDRSQFYVTNAVKFRPTKVSAAGRTVNRPPTQEEIRLFLPWLRREIELVQPECVATLGNVPLRALAERRVAIGDVHGAFLDCGGVRVYPMYHPASVIYNPALREAYRADVLRLAQWLRANDGQGAKC